ncbi:MAG: hypothetical protein QGD92_14790 [Gammaproteobacteria bacterium]|nr:hypothetical protein [Gammaproteobacteria bacterium]
MAEAEECANIACFLCSEQGFYISGTAINLDGNFSLALQSLVTSSGDC